MIFAILLASLPVHEAIDKATTDPDLRVELRRICQRESHCEPITIHAADAGGGARRWKRAVARGYLHPETCPAHALGDGAQWSTYGPFGIASAWTVRFAGSCEGPSALDDPRVAAKAAVAFMRRLCTHYGACSCEDRTRWWVGPSVWESRSHIDRELSLTRQCGVRMWWHWGAAALRDVVAGLA